MWDILEKAYKIISSPATLFCAAIIIMVIYTLRTETNFLNIKKVFSDYHKIFKNARKHLLIFWGVPVLPALALIQIAPLDANISETLLVFLSILIAAFFSMLSILVTQQGHANTSNQFKSVLKESASIALVEIILCILALIITLSSLIIGTNFHHWIKIVLSFFDYYVIFVMLLNILILIKRTKALIDNTK